MKRNLLCLGFKVKTWPGSSWPILNNLISVFLGFTFLLSKMKNCNDEMSPRGGCKDMWKGNDQGKFPRRSGLQWGWTISSIQGAVRRPWGQGSSWGFATPKRMLLISQEVVWRKTWSTPVHSASLNNLPVNCFFSATGCHNLACGNHLGNFLSLGSVLPDSKALLTWHLKWVTFIFLSSWAPGFPFRDRSMLLGPPSRHLCQCLWASCLLRKTLPFLVVLLLSVMIFAI